MEAATISVIVEVPAPGIDVGLKPAVTPAGRPVADKEMAELKSFVTVLVIVIFPELPRITDTDPGDAESVKPGPDEVPAIALISPARFGLPQPVAKSYPVVAS